MLILVTAMGFAAAAFSRRFRLYTIITITLMLSFGAWSGMEAPRIEAGLATPWVGVKEPSSGTPINYGSSGSLLHCSGRENLSRVDSSIFTAQRRGSRNQAMAIFWFSGITPPGPAFLSRVRPPPIAVRTFAPR